MNNYVYSPKRFGLLPSAKIHTYHIPVTKGEAMLTESQRNEIHKFFLNALRETLSSEQNRKAALERDPLLNNRDQKANISQLANIYKVSTYDMQIIISACKVATLKTQKEIKVNAENFEEVTNEINTYKDIVIPLLTKDCSSHLWTPLWSTIDKNLAQLDAEIKVPDFTEKYQFEIKTAGLVLGILAVGGGLLWAASNMSGNSSGPMPPTSGFSI